MQIALRRPQGEFFTRHKLLAIFGLCLVPLAFHLCRNYLMSGRGWHVHEIQYVTISWTVRLLLIPFVLLMIRKSFNILLGLFLFTGAQLITTMILCLQTSSTDKRLWNLFHTIKDEALVPNLVIYTISILICYLWIKAEIPKPASLNIKSGQKTTIANFPDIISIHSDGHYAKIITSTKTSLMSISMRELQKMLPVEFVRIHRSTIINTLHIAQTRSLLNGDYLVTMKNGDQHKVSRTYREDLRAVLGKF